MRDCRRDIVEAGIAMLCEQGYSGFTQPRIAARAGLRQSHITYYYPTRLDLLAAVGRAAVDRQLADVDHTLGSLSSPEEAARALANLVTRHENTRVLMTLAQAGDEEPLLRELFCELADGIVVRVSAFLSHLGGNAVGEEIARLLHALSVGLAVVDLATGRQDGKQRADAVLKTALHLIAGGAAPKRRPTRITPKARKLGEAP